MAVKTFDFNFPEIKNLILGWIVGCKRRKFLIGRGIYLESSEVSTKQKFGCLGCQLHQPGLRIRALQISEDQTSAGGLSKQW